MVIWKKLCGIAIYNPKFLVIEYNEACLAFYLFRLGNCLRYCLLGGFIACPLQFICGPLSYWLSCEPCLGARQRRELRGKYHIVDEPSSDMRVHCFCHPCALCQEARFLAQLKRPITADILKVPPPPPELDLARSAMDPPTYPDLAQDVAEREGLPLRAVGGRADLVQR